MTPDPLDALNQIDQISHNPSGLPGASDYEQHVAALEDEIQYQKELQQNLQFAYGTQGMPKPSMLPDEKQLHYLFDTQPKKADVEEIEKWNSVTLMETEILRHVQFGQMDRAESADVMREIADINVLLDQFGKEDEALVACRELYITVLLSKSTIHEGRPTASEMILSPINRSEIKQTINQPQRPSAGGFWSFLPGGGKK
jgi:hypothetical protein